MKFSCIRSYFLDALTIAERAIKKTTTLPLLQHVHIRADKNKTTLSTTNLEIGIRATFQAKVSDEGEFTVPLTPLRGFLASITDEKLTTQVKENSFFLQTDAHQAEIKGATAKDFPIIPEVKGIFTTKLVGREFFSILGTLLPFTNQGSVRPELAGVFCSFEKERIRMAATDSFRLGERLLKNKNSKEHQCIIPTQAALEAVRIFGGSEEVVFLADPNQFLFKTQERELVSRLIEEKYPDYENIIPVSFHTQIILVKEELVRALHTASVFGGKNNDIKIQFTPEKKRCIFESRHSDLGEQKSEVSCEGRGDSLVISCNYKYLLDAIAGIKDEAVSIEGNKETDPILLRSAVSAGARYLVMPLRPY